MRYLNITLLSIALLPSAPVQAQQPGRYFEPPRDRYPEAQPRHSDLRHAIASGVPFRVRLNPGQDRGSLRGGAVYEAQYNPRIDSFTVTGPGLWDGAVSVRTYTYHSGDPWEGEFNLFGASYLFDERGSVYLGDSGQLVGRLWLADRR